MRSISFVLWATASFGVSALQLQRPMPLQIKQEQAPLAAPKPALQHLPLIDSEELQSRISSRNLLARAKELYEIAKLGEEEFGNPTRVIGSKGHLGTLDYIYFNLLKLGNYYTLSNQTFPAVSGKVFESRLVIGDDIPETTTAFGMSPATKNKQPVFGELVLVKNSGCDASDFPSEVKGNIAFIARGKCAFGKKSDLAGKAGATAAVIYNIESGPLHGTLGTPTPDHVATFGLSDEEAPPFLEKLQSGEKVDAIAYMDAVVSQIATDNIIAQTTAGDPNNCVMLGGHSDSVAEGPGINDDGSGSLSLLEIATQLANFRVNNCVRFSWWAGEEEGLLGSDYYVDELSEEENMKIRLFMDYDMMASPNFAYQIYDANNEDNPNGSQELKDLYVKWYQKHDLNYTFIPFDGRSDYDGFIRHGIPGGGIATGAEGEKTKEEAAMFGGVAGDWYDPCYHQLCDDVGNVNATAWEVNTKLIAHSVATYALSLKGFPERTSSKTTTSASERKAKYHGRKLIM